MSKILLVSFLVFSMQLPVNSAELSCELIESYKDQAGSISNDDGEIYFFKKIVRNAKTQQSKKIESQQKRMAVQNFYGTCGTENAEYGDYCYEESMTNKEVDELGEGIYVYTYLGKNKKKYTAVNVGFGGGNSSVYYFDFESLNMQPIRIIDGFDCTRIKTKN